VGFPGTGDDGKILSKMYLRYCAIASLVCIRTGRHILSAQVAFLLVGGRSCFYIFVMKFFSSSAPRFWFSPFYSLWIEVDSGRWLSKPINHASTTCKEFRLIYTVIGKCELLGTGGFRRLLWFSCLSTLNSRLSFLLIITFRRENGRNWAQKCRAALYPLVVM